MTNLCKLAKHYGTDKYPYYTPFYDALLKSRRETVRNVLEIGVGTPGAMSHMPGYQPGASLRMWQDYFPNATILGLDVVPMPVLGARIDTEVVDQRNELVLYAAAASWSLRYDLILDDGSHGPQDQVNTARTLVPLLAPGGLYIIEDVNDPEAVAAELPFQNSVVRTHYGEYEGKLILVSNVIK